MSRQVCLQAAAQLRPRPVENSAPRRQEGALLFAFGPLQVDDPIIDLIVGDGLDSCN